MLDNASRACSRQGSKKEPANILLARAGHMQGLQKLQLSEALMQI